MPFSLQDIQVSSVVVETGVDDKGARADSIRVYYHIGPHGPFSVAIPKPMVSAQAVLQAIRQDAQQLLEILNIQF
jgi:hypothetical protein